MRSSIKKLPPKAAFLPIGFGLIAVGQSDNLALMGAGIVFVIIGAVAIREHRNSCVQERRFGIGGNTMWEYFDRRARRLGILDTKLVQGAAVFFALTIVKLAPEILEINIWWFVALTILCAIKPVLTFFGSDRSPTS